MEKAIEIVEKHLKQVEETLELVRNAKTYDTWNARKMIITDILRDLRKEAK